MLLHKFDKRLISVGTVAEKLSDEAEFKRHRWHGVAATSEKREMFPRATSEGFYAQVGMVWSRKAISVS